MATKREILRQQQQRETLQRLGFTEQEAEQLRRISMTLHRWRERECNGEVQRGDDGVARGYRVNARFLDPNDPRYWYAVPDREAGARKRLSRILLDRLNRTKDADGTIKGPALSAYIQGDPRGAALYILRPGDVPAGEDAGAYYSRGICVY